MAMILELEVKRSVEHDGANAQAVGTKLGPFDWAAPLILPFGSATYFRTTAVQEKYEPKSESPKLLGYTPNLS